MQHYNKRYKYYLIIASIFSSLFIDILIWSSFVPEDGEVSKFVVYGFIGTYFGLLILSIIVSILTWHYTTYGLTDDGVVLKKGIIFKSTKIVPYEKIHAVDTQQNLLHLVFGLKKLSIHSGSTTKADMVEIKIIESSKITTNLEKEIRSRMSSLARVDLVEGKDDNGEEVIYYYSKKQKLMVSLLQTIVFIIISVPIIAMIAIPILLIPDPELEDLSIYFILVIVVGLWFIVFISSYVFNLIRYFNYRVFMKDGYLLINHGLITKYNNTLPLNKIKAIKIEENIFERMFRLCKIKVEVVGFGLQTNNEQQVVNYFIPFCYKKEVNKYISKLRLKYEFKERSMLPPRRALKYFDSLHLYIFTLIYLPLLPIVFLIENLTIAMLVYIGVYLFVGLIIYLVNLLRYSNSGLYIDDELVIVNNGSLNKKNTIILRENVTTIDKVDTYCRKRKNIASFNIHYFNTAYKNVEKVHLIDADNIDKINNIIIY